MFEDGIDEAIREIEEFCKSLTQLLPTSDEEALAVEKARAQAARIAEQLRELRDTIPVEVEGVT